MSRVPGNRASTVLRGPGRGNAPRLPDNTFTDHIEAARLALAQLPRPLRRKALIRADSGGGTHEFLDWLTATSRRLHYSVGMTITEAIAAAIGKIPAMRRRRYDGTGRSATGRGSPTSPACRTYEVGAGRTGCCTHLLYRPSGSP